MKKPIVAALLLCGLTACSSFAQATSTPVPTQTFTPFPTATATSAPTSTPLLPTETPDVLSELAPEGLPASEWEEIPIMPDAIAGEGDAEGYIFAIQATPQQVQEYYQVELGKLGWQLLGQGEGKDSSLILIFTNDASATLTVSILVKGNQVLVLLVK